MVEVFDDFGLISAAGRVLVELFGSLVVHHVWVAAYLRGGR